MNQNNNGSSSEISRNSTPRVNRIDSQDVIKKIENVNDLEIYELKQDKRVTLEFLKILSNSYSDTAIENFAGYLKINVSAKKNINDPLIKNEIADAFLTAKNNKNINFCDKIIDSIDNKEVLMAIKEKLSTNPSYVTSPTIAQKLDTKIEKSNGICTVS